MWGKNVSEMVIVSSSGAVGLVGGARIEPTDLAEFSGLTTHLVAADGGADHLLEARLVPSAVIGDMDSISETARLAFAGQLHPVAEQETTDFEKALMRIDAACILAFGFTGGRMDHVLSVLNVLARYRHCAVVLLDESDASFILPDNPVTLNLPPDTRLSLMPLAELRATATGLRWPLHDRVLHPAGTVSSSNAVAEGPVKLQADGPLLITLPRAHLAQAVTAAARAR